MMGQKICMKTDESKEQLVSIVRVTINSKSLTNSDCALSK